VTSNRAAYRSSIPAAARQRVVERYPEGAKKNAEYRLRGKLVGVRWFHETGEPDFEYALRDGQKHGTQYRWDVPGHLLSAEPFEDGLPHGTARQWSRDGRQIGTYRMRRGTGIDLWRQEREDGSVYLAEILYKRAGRPDGFEWWVNEDQRTVYIERHWCDCQLHGIYREWNDQGRLRHGSPQYFVRSERVTKRQYLRGAANDPTLPPFRAADNRPTRRFPVDVGRSMNLPGRGSK